MLIKVFDKEFDIEEKNVSTFNSAIEHAREKERNTVLANVNDRTKGKLSDLFNIEDIENKTLKQVISEMSENNKLITEKMELLLKEKDVQPLKEKDQDEIIELKKIIAQNELNGKTEIDKIKKEHIVDNIYRSILPYAIQKGLNKLEQKNYCKDVREFFGLEIKDGNGIFLNTDEMPVMNKENKPATSEDIAGMMKEIYPHRHAVTNSGTGGNGTFQINSAAGTIQKTGLHVDDRMRQAYNNGE